MSRGQRPDSTLGGSRSPGGGATFGAPMSATAATAATPPFRLLTLGGLSLERDACPVTGPASQLRRLGLLALVSAHGRTGLSRDRLLAILWPDLSEKRARGALAQLRYAMRRDLGEELLGSGPTLRLEPALVVCDRDALECALLHG